MFTKTILTAGFIALAAAAPTATSTSKYYGISLNVNVSPSGVIPTYEPAPIRINKLTKLGARNGVPASQLVFDRGVAVNVDINSVECRAYKDKAGVIPGSAAFTNANPAELSTNLVEVGSVLCYIT